MFTSFSLCPGGAFMMCESVAEFDPNAPDPVAQDLVTAEPDSAPVQAVVAENTSCDPIAKLIGKLGPLYDKVDAVVSEPMDFLDDPESAMAKLDFFDGLASEITNKMRMIIMKQKAAGLCMDDESQCGRSWVYGDFQAHLGKFIRAGARLKQEGYDRISYSYSTIDCLASRYDVLKIVSIYTTATSDELPETPFDFDQLRGIMAQYGNFLDAFKDTKDLFDCMFKSPERLARLEVSRPESIDVYHLMNSCTDRDYYGPIAPSYSPEDYTCTTVKYISQVLRKVKRCIYDLQCDIMDGKSVDPSCVKCVMSGIANLFYIPGIIAFANAYQMRGSIARKDAISDFVTVVTRELNLR